MFHLGAGDEIIILQGQREELVLRVHACAIIK